jgi:hypothetical protein
MKQEKGKLPSSMFIMATKGNVFFVSVHSLSVSFWRNANVIVTIYLDWKQMNRALQSVVQIVSRVVTTQMK